jgi:hypothetical protein
LKGRPIGWSSFRDMVSTNEVTRLLQAGETKL